MEPHKLRRWRLDLRPDGYGRFYTCARPGRSMSKTAAVSDEVVSLWVSELVRQLQRTGVVIVSLLGHKPGPSNRSEFSFYSFCGGDDTPTERKTQPTLQQWLDLYHKDLQIRVVEHPTIDCPEIPLDVLTEIAANVLNLIAEGKTVVVMDSGGEQRTGKVRRYMGAVEDFGHCPTGSHCTEPRR